MTTKKRQWAARKSEAACSAILRVGRTGMTIAYCSKPHGHGGRHASRHLAGGYGLAGFVFISWPNESVTVAAPAAGDA
jgi:hypothetical protein